MSAIVYSDYVEAIAPGTFQKNMSEMYKLNGLKPINFPIPPMSDIILESCREVFQGSHGTETETNQMTKNEETEEQT